jgi:hypothetical protein
MDSRRWLANQIECGYSKGVRLMLEKYGFALAWRIALTVASGVYFFIFAEGQWETIVSIAVFTFAAVQTIVAVIAFSKARNMPENGHNSDDYKDNGG